MGGYTSNCEKKSKSLHPTVQYLQTRRTGFCLEGRPEILCCSLLKVVCNENQGGLSDRGNRFLLVFYCNFLTCFLYNVQKGTYVEGSPEILCCLY
jgi:hypothetical protein